MSVRAVGHDEVPLVWSVHQRAFADLATSVPLDLAAWREHRVERDPAFDASSWFLAVAGDEPIGVCLARPSTPEAAEVGDVTLQEAVSLYRAAGMQVVARTDVMELALSPPR